MADRVSDERLAAIIDVANPKYSTGVHVPFSETQQMARELRQRRAAEHWIPVSERVPDYGIPVLVIYHGVVQHTVYARDVGEYRAIDDASDPMPESFVTHWRPLPAVPEEGQ